MAKKTDSTKVVAALSTKGGTGKTTLIANIAGALAELNKKVLAIDADLGQPSLSSYYPLKSPLKNKNLSDFMEALIEAGDADTDVINQTEIDNLDVILSAGDMDREVKLRQFMDASLLLSDVVKKYRAKYDYIFIDTSGSAALLSSSAIVAADIILLPVRPEMISARELVRGTVDLIRRAVPMRKRFNMSAPKIFCVFNGVGHTRDCAEVVKALRHNSHEFKDIDLRYLKNMVYQRSVFNVAASRCCTLSKALTRSEARKDNSALKCIYNVVSEVGIPTRNWENIVYEQKNAS